MTQDKALQALHSKNERLGLYKDAYAKRTWVGLTRIELIKCGVLPYGMSYELYQAIEAKLKDKNS